MTRFRYNDLMSHEAMNPIETILGGWLEDPDLTIFCGHWGNGGVMELLPRGGARLSGPRYDAPFDGLRELQLTTGGHHVHLDLSRLIHACYFVAPSVCYGYRPSFEVRLTNSHSGLRDQFGIGLALTHPYAGYSVRGALVRRYFRRAAEHMDRFPQAVSFICDRLNSPIDVQADWSCIESLLEDVDAGAGNSMRSIRSALRNRMQCREAAG